MFCIIICFLLFWVDSVFWRPFLRTSTIALICSSRSHSCFVSMSSRSSLTSSSSTLGSVLNSIGRRACKQMVSALRNIGEQQNMRKESIQCTDPMQSSCSVSTNLSNRYNVWLDLSLCPLLWGWYALVRLLFTPVKDDKGAHWPGCSKFF